MFKTTIAVCQMFLLCLLFSCSTAPELIPEAEAYRPEKVIADPSGAYLSPEESLKTFHLPQGYRLELVASEPEIQEPVAIAWDGNGRMYVAEMRTYMDDIDGTNENLPLSRITRFEDTDGDGKMDKHTVYLDSLVLPRMILPLDDRLLVNETYSYNIHSYRDTDGDGVADEKILVYQNDRRDNANLEHQRSGLIWNMDNWIYTTTSLARYRYRDGKLVADTVPDGIGGQWGLTQDDYGRMYFSSAGGENPAFDFQQNPIYGKLSLKDQRADGFDAVWPIIATPDVQGGLHRVRDDSTLNHFTGACGQSIFRGDRLPVNLKGDLFIPEPVGRLIRRAKVTNENGKRVLRNAYDKAEFLTSTDMNFRPVNTATGPDGCLYIVDMHHGIIQESAWTGPNSYIRPHIQHRGLDKNIDRGRIYRLVHDGYKPGPQPALLDADSEELVAYLSHPNGWWRDNAQKLLIIRNDHAVIPALKKIVSRERSLWDKISFRKEPPAVASVHALWTLEGLGAIDESTLLKAYQDEDPEVRKAAVRISEPFLKENNQPVFEALETLKEDASADVRIQLALSLRHSNDEKSRVLLGELLDREKENELLASAVATSLQETDAEIKKLREQISDMGRGDQKLVIAGAAHFKQYCSTCHGNDGKGLESKVAPPLIGSKRVVGDEDILVKILLHGMTGPIDGQSYPDVMPPLHANDNQYIAEVASYVRNAMGNRAPAVRPGKVRAIREQTKDREQAWTLEELNRPK